MALGISARVVHTVVAMLAGLALTGCFSAVSLNKVVVAYDEAVTDALSKQLLINIARSQYREPIHFTGVSNVAATFDFRVQGGITPALAGNVGISILPLAGGRVAENPTISIVPIEGEEFTERLLTPLDEAKLTLLLRQGVDIDLLLRLMAQELRVKEGGREVAYRNLPSDRAGDEMFRRVVLHISAIQVDHPRRLGDRGGIQDPGRTIRGHVQPRDQDLHPSQVGHGPDPHHELRTGHAVARRARQVERGGRRLVSGRPDLRHPAGRSGRRVAHTGRLPPQELQRHPDGRRVVAVRGGRI